MLNKIFCLNTNNTTIKKEVLAGITTFLSMAYILAVNPAILSDDTGLSFAGVLVATAIASGIGCFLMGIIANYPVGVAPGMGVNALFTFTVIKTMKVSAECALAGVFVSGVLFLIISVSGLREKIIKAIPEQLKIAIGVGIGFFIAFVGLKDLGLIISNPDTIVGLGNLQDPKILLGIVGIVIIFILLLKKIPAAIFIGMLLTTILGLILGGFNIEGMPIIKGNFNLNLDFSTFGLFGKGFSELFANIPNMIIIVFSFLFVDFFDTTGTLLAVAQRANLISEKGEIKNGSKAMLADSLATIIGAILGTSTVTSFVESTSGVEVGGRTGLSAIVTGVLFIGSLILAPFIPNLVTSSITAPALVGVGILMSQQLNQIKWENLMFAIPCFMTIIMMILTYSMSAGIAFGFLSYSILSLLNKKEYRVHPIIWILDLIFIIYLGFMI